MRIDIVSLFPDFFDAFFNHSIIKRAIETERLSVGVTNPRDFSHNKHGQVDDTPYGGGAGMLMMAPPIFEAVESVIAQYDSSVLRHLMGYVFQQAYLFKGSIRDNLTLFDTSISNEDMVNAAKQVNLHSMIEHLPEGYDTPVGYLGYLLLIAKSYHICCLLL